MSSSEAGIGPGGRRPGDVPLADVDFQRVFDEAPAPFLLLTPDFDIVHANRARLEATATTLEQTVGRNLFEVFPMNPGDAAADGLRNLRDSLVRARESKQPQTMAIQKYDIPLPDGTWVERYWSPRNVPILDDAGEVVLLLHRADDITEYVVGRDAGEPGEAPGAQWLRRVHDIESDLFARTRELQEVNRRLQEAHRHAEQAAARTALLAEMSRDLSETLDADEAVGRLAQLLVPTLADWCLVTLVVDENHPDWRRSLTDVGTWHADPAMRPVLQRYARVRLAALTDDSPVGRALRTTQPVVVPHDATEAFCRVLTDPQARSLLTDLAPDSAVIFPLRGRGRTVGLVSLFNCAGRPPLSGEDFGTAGEIAGRAALALDNARLYGQQRELAEALQRALLTPPPQPDHLQIAVRYVPAAEAAQVGGDWYDAFLQDGGATVLVIGDVVGHDTAAAAAMGQVRTILRAVAARTGAGPADVLQEVDEIMHTLQVSTTASAVVVRLEQTADERFRDITRMRWSNAGHPPPLIVDPDGSVTTLSGAGTDLLLGVHPEASRTESAVTLTRGTTVLLHTDGLVERRDRSLDDGLTLLRGILHDVAAQGGTLDELCDELLARMLPGRAEDDVALIAVHLYPEDQLAD